jgi:hypothetical protein
MKRPARLLKIGRGMVQKVLRDTGNVGGQFLLTGEQARMMGDVPTNFPPTIFSRQSFSQDFGHVAGLDGGEMLHLMPAARAGHHRRRAVGLALKLFEQRFGDL